MGIGQQEPPGRLTPPAPRSILSRSRCRSKIRASDWLIAAVGDGYERGGPGALPSMPRWGRVRRTPSRVMTMSNRPRRIRAASANWVSKGHLHGSPPGLSGLGRGRRSPNRLVYEGALVGEDSEDGALGSCPRPRPSAAWSPSPRALPGGITASTMARRRSSGASGSARCLMFTEQIGK